MPKTTHGLSRSPEYAAWANITNRCLRPSHPSFKGYGARGVSICDAWSGRGGFARFFAHIGPRPTPAHQVDRIDNSKGYEPGNVRWATRKEQMNNTRSNHWIEIDGEIRTLREWSIANDIHETTIIHRIRRGMSARDAVLVPAKFSGRRAST